MKKLYLLLLLAPVCMCLHSCKPDDNTPPAPGVFKAPQEVIDYCYFKEGTYWIYRDSVSGQYDTVSVISSNFDTLTNTNDGVKEYYDIFDVITYRSFDKYNEATWLRDRPWLITGAPIVYQTRYKPGDSKGTSIYHFHPYTLGRKIEDNNDIISLSGALASYTVLSQSYQSILVFSHAKDPNYDYSSTKIYQAKNIGIIKKVITAKNQVWELINYNIVQ